VLLYCIKLECFSVSATSIVIYYLQERVEPTRVEPIEIVVYS